MKRAPKLPRELLRLICRHEGVCLKAYVCPAGILTIGVGHVITKADRRAGLHLRTLTKEEAMALLARDIEARIPQVTHLIEDANPAQFGAILSFIFNVGSGNFRASTLRRLHNRGQHAGASAEFPKWRRAAGKILKGLVRRRAEERELYDGGGHPAAAAVCSACGR